MTAVVIGASIAGLTAARVLADRFGSVTVLDRDTLPDGAAPRRAAEGPAARAARLGPARAVQLVRSPARHGVPGRINTLFFRVQQLLDPPSVLFTPS
jgi:glycine/D-amino acid oxidase-like deaminating enzyme